MIIVEISENDIEILVKPTEKPEDIRIDASNCVVAGIIALEM